MADALRAALVAATVVVALTLVASPVAAENDGLDFGTPIDGENGGADGGATVNASSDGVAVGIAGTGTSPTGQSTGGAVECELGTDTRSNPCTTDGPGAAPNGSDGPGGADGDQHATFDLDAEERSATVGAGGSGSGNGQSAGGAVECEVSPDTRSNPCTSDRPGDGELPVESPSESVTVGAGGSGNVNGQSVGGSVECELGTDTRSNPCTTERPGDGELPVEPPTQPPTEPPTLPSESPIPVSSLQQVVALDDQLL